MTPETYLNTYSSYKAGTSNITTWLARSARRVGVDFDATVSAPSSANGSTKPKKREATSATKKYQIPLKEFASIAKAIATSTDPKIRLPKAIVSMIRDVIALRKQATDFFVRFTKSKSSAAVQAANAGHRHFIAVLEEVLTILKPEDDKQTELPNMFEALTVEETLEVAEANEPAPATDANQYELQTTGEDIVFAILSFFKDVNEVREYLQGVWTDYRQGKVDVMSAAVTTDTAFVLLEHSSQDIAEAIPGEATYPGMVAILTDYLEKLGGVNEHFGDWTCLQTASLLNSYADVLEPGQLPVMKAGHFGIYNPKRDRSKLSAEEKHNEDLIVLMELLPEFTKLSRTKLYVPAQDELTTGLRQMMDANTMDALPTYAIFGTQILLDIHHVLRQDTARPFEQLQATGKRVISTLDDYFRYSRGRSISNWPPENDEVFRQISAQAKDWTVTDTVGKAIVKGVGNVRPRPYYLLKNHPVLCGLLTFRLNVLLNGAGMNLCTAWGTVLYPAHLYNAARQSADLDAEWKDMEYILSVHSLQRIFVGAPPSDPQEYLKRFLLTLGASASNFARNRRPGGRALIVESKKGPRGLKTTSPVKDIFRAHYLYESPIALTTPNIVAMLAVASKAERTSWPSVDMAEFSRKMIVQRQYTTLQLLTAVREGVASEELHLLFDYFGLHQRSSRLLRDLQTHTQHDLVKYFGSDYIEEESQLPYIIGYIFEVVRGSDRISEQLRVQNGGSRMLHDAAAVLARFLESGENSGKGIMGAKALSHSVAHAFANGTLG
ncbi:hypothetical protein LTR85_000652 [Meristemomyces frigidus]|nr:hypothetical protein LTR85_000652 [Meristemomyces frigidus]